MTDSQPSTPTDSRNFDPVADAMARANASSADAANAARAKLEENNRRATLIKTWREHPDVVSYCNDQRTDFPSWEAFVADTDPAWGVLDERTCLARACHQRIGMAELPEADRTILADRHPFETRPLIDPIARKWVLVRDTATVCPVDVTDVWAADYRLGLHEQLRERGMLAGLEPGKPPVLAVWVGVSRPPGVWRDWIKGIGGERFAVLLRSDACAWWVSLEPLVQATHAHPAALAARPASAVSGAVRTGIAALDAQLRVGGIPDGSLVIVQGGPKACKTTTELQLARAAREQGAEVVIIAGDESPAELRARLWQQRGLDSKEARERALRGEQPDPGVYVVDPREHPLQRILDSAASHAPIRMIVAESIQTLAPGGQHEIDALLVRLRATGKTVVAASEVVVSTRGRRAKGSTSIGYQASLTLDVERKGDAVRLRPMHSRLGTEKPIDLVLDADRQILAELDAASVRSVSEADGRMLEAIRAALAGGPLTQRKILARVTGGQNAIVRVLKAAVTDGNLTCDAGKYAVRGAR